LEIEEKKDLASSWFRNLRDQFCKEFETLDGSKLKERNGIILEAVAG
jgi:Coproporphyrinogen III oxidase